MRRSDKLQKLNELYPPEAIASKRAFLDAFWEGKTINSVPFTLRRRDVPLGYDQNEFEMGYFAHEQVLDAQLDDILLKASICDDYIPILITGNSPYYLSIAFGTRWEKLNKGALVSHPVIYNVEELGKLGIPDYEKLPQSPFTKCMDRIDFFLEATKSLIPLALPDPQGPMSLACQLWDQQELFISIHTQPEAVHMIMRICTDAIIGFFNYLFRRFGREHFSCAHCHPYIYKKEASGIAVSEDMFGVLSPETLKEFLLPYLQELQSRFGPLLLHSCGDCSRKFGILKELHGLAGVHFGQTDIRSVLPEQVKDLCLLSPNDWENCEQIANYVLHLKRNHLRGWVQIHTIQGLIDQKGESVSYQQWADVARFLQKICRENRQIEHLKEGK
ncbi:MAG: hypothetical protein ABIG61_00440 [Planctomycetota bacterium]